MHIVMERIDFNQDKIRIENLEGGLLNPNLNPTERIISVTAGALLLTKSFKKSFSPIKLLSGSYLIYRGISGKCVLQEKIGEQIKHVSVNARVILTINKPREEVYSFWRELSNLPKFMSHIKTVVPLTETTSRWTLKLPWETGEISWESLIVKDEPNQLIGWHSEKMALLENSGKAEFIDAPNGRGTVVSLVVSYHPPAGEFGRKIANLLSPAFENVLKQDLRNFKQLMETGEIASTHGQPSGRDKIE